MYRVLGSDSVIGLNIAMILLTGIAVSLRFMIRAKSKASFAADDWWLLPSVIFFYTSMGTQFWCEYFPSATMPLVDKLGKGVNNVGSSTSPILSLSSQELLAKVFSSQDSHQYILNRSLGLVHNSTIRYIHRGHSEALHPLPLSPYILYTALSPRELGYRSLRHDLLDHVRPHIPVSVQSHSRRMEANTAQQMHRHSRFLPRP